MIAHVICCNDSVEHVVIGDEATAQAVLEELRDEYFERNKWNFEERHHWKTGEVIQTREESYKQRCYWHIHAVPLTAPTIPSYYMPREE